MQSMISYGRQTIEEDDIAAVVKALKSATLTQGPLVEEFEEALCSYTGARYAVSCSSGTAALHLACVAADLTAGDGVLTSPVTFLASANAALYAGATPAFADIDPLTYNIDPKRIEEKLQRTKGLRAVIPVHFAGLPCDMEGIRRIARRKRLVVIEDACHALGAAWRDSRGRWRTVGSCSHSDMTVFSFHPVKTITTGEGGAITTNDEGLYKRLKSLRSHGVTKDSRSFRNASEGPWSYEMQELGFNFRLTDIQSALGISQIKKIDRFVQRRTEIASKYTRLLSRYHFIKTPHQPEGSKSANHLYPVWIAFDEIGASRKQWFELMKDIGISLQVHYIPVHLQPFYQESFGYRTGDFPDAEHLYSGEVSLPIYPSLTDEEVSTVVAAVISTLACTVAPRVSRRQGMGLAAGVF